MENDRVKKLILRWSVVLIGGIGIFWTSWYMIFGGVPIITYVTITKDWTYVFSFGISRWWDIICAPIIITIIILLWALASKKGYDKEIISKFFSDKSLNMENVLICGIGIGCILTFLSGANTAVLPMYLAGLFTSLLVSLIFNLVFGLTLNLGFISGFSLIRGLFFWFLPALATSLVFSFIFIAILTKKLLMKFFRSKLAPKLKLALDWLMAK